MRRHPGVPATSPDIRTTGFTPSWKESVREISTWSSFRTGPSTRTFFSSPLGPATVTVSAAAYWPGWDRSFKGVS